MLSPWQRAIWQDGRSRETWRQRHLWCGAVRRGGSRKPVSKGCPTSRRRLLVQPLSSLLLPGPRRPCCPVTWAPCSVCEPGLLCGSPAWLCWHGSLPPRTEANLAPRRTGWEWAPRGSAGCPPARPPGCSALRMGIAGLPWAAQRLLLLLRPRVPSRPGRGSDGVRCPAQPREHRLQNGAVPCGRQSPASPSRAPSLPSAQPSSRLPCICMMGFPDGVVLQLWEPRAP